MLTPRPIIPEEFALSPKDSLCFEFLIKSYKFSHNVPNVFDFLDKKVTSLFKINGTFSQISI